MSKPSLSTPDRKARAARPRVGLWIVWRYKGDKGWQVGYVRDSYAGGYVVYLTENEYSSGYSGSKVCADDIDWRKK